MGSSPIRYTMWKIRKIIRKGDYEYALVPEHPNATKNGYVLHHRIVMENSIGRLLTDDEEVHHIDFNKLNNAITNLKLMTNHEHRMLHASLCKRTYARIICPGCGKEYVALKRKSVDKKQYCCSRHCGRLFQLLTKEEKEKRISSCVVEIFKQ